jgi:CHAD domain-containing protein
MAAHPAEPRAQRYDTAECRLSSWGAALLRHANVWVVELPPTKLGSLAARTRFEFPAARTHPPEEALDLVAAFARGAPLVRMLDEEIEAVTAPSTDPAPDAAPPTPGAVIRAALLASVTRWIQHDPGVRLGLDPEDVHQARVATRRLRSDLGSFQSLLDPEWARALRADLRPFASALGTVRDLDVLQARLAARIAALESAELRAAEELVAGLERERADARAALLERMRAPEYLALLDRCLGAAREPALLEGADAAACDALLEGLRRRWRRLEREVRRAGDAPAPEALHAIRIRAKRCRYAAEALAGVDGKRVKALARALSRLQDVLGEHQDAIIAASWLRRVGAHASDEGRFAAGVLAGAELAAAEAARSAWRREWRRARDCASRAQLR